MKTPIEMLNAIIEMQEANYGNGINTHMKLSELAKEAKEVVKNFDLSDVSKRLFLVGYIYDGEHCSKEVEAPNELAAKCTAISGLKGRIKMVSCLELNAR